MKQLSKSLVPGIEIRKVLQKQNDSSEKFYEIKVLGDHLALSYNCSRLHIKYVTGVNRHPAGKKKNFF